MSRGLTLAVWCAGVIVGAKVLVWITPPLIVALLNAPLWLMVPAATVVWVVLLIWLALPYIRKRR